MKHLKKEIINDFEYNFYDGIDIDLLLNHNKDGKDGFIYIFIDNWDNEVKKIKRQSKIKELLYNTESIDLENINNSFIIIYTNPGIIVHKMLDIIIKQIKISFNNNPYSPLSLQ